MSDWWADAPVAGDKGEWWKAAPVDGAPPDPPPTVKPAPQRNLIERVADFATAPARGLIERADVGGGLTRGATGLLASTRHAVGDFIDQTVQAGPRAIMRALTGGAETAYDDPLGARAGADEALAVNREVGFDRTEAAARIGGRPTLAQVLENPTAALEQGAAYYGSQAAESLPAMALAIATRNPELGAGILGGTTGVQSYTDLRGQGVGRGDAAEVAALSGLAEAAGESFGLPAVMSRGGGLQSLIMAALKEGGQEAPVAVAQRNIEDQATGRETPIVEQLLEALDASVVGAGIGAGAKVATNPTLAPESPVATAPVDLVEVLRAAQAARDAATPPPAEATPPPAPAAAPRQGVPEPPVGAMPPERAVSPVEAADAVPATDVPPPRPVEAPVAPAAQVAAPGDEAQAVDLSAGTRGTVRDGSTRATYDVLDDGTVRLNSLTTPKKDRGQGTGRKVLQEFLADVDAADRPSTLTVAPMSADTTAEGLQKLYESEGYEVVGQDDAGNPLMRRPASSERAAAPPAAPAPPPTGRVTSTKNEFTDAERAERGAEPIIMGGSVSNEATIDKARKALKATPERGAEVVEKLRNAGTEGISLDDEAILLAEKVRLQTARDAAAERASDLEATEEQRAVAQREWEAAEESINQLDEAARAGGAEWGRLGQFRQQLLRDDYTFAALERKARAREGRPLTMEESATLKIEADKFQALQAKLDETQKALDEAATQAGAAQTFQQLVQEMKTSLRSERAKPRPALATLKARADAARAKLQALEPAKNTKRQGGSAIDPRAFVYLSEIGAYHVANGAVTFAEWVARMAADIGAAFKSLSAAGKRAVYKAAKEQAVAVAAAPRKVRDAAAVLKDIDPAKLTHNDVYDLAAAKVASGMKGEAEVMAAVTEELQAVAPGITERDVRRLFSEYGKAKFPSKDADKKKLRELRALVQLQESIDRLNEGLKPLNSGLQRDKATEEIRTKRAQLNQLIKSLSTGATPEEVDALNEARARNLKNQIADLERQIETGERPTKPPAPEPNEEVRRLREVRDDLKAQLKAIDDSGKPVETPDSRYQKARATSIAKQIAQVRARIAANDYARAEPKAPRQLNAANTQAAFDLAKAKQEFARKQFESEMKKRSPIRKAFAHSIDGINLARAIMTSFDLSGVLRQGGFISLGRPLLAANGIPGMLKSFVSEKAQFASADEIAKRENAPLYKRYGLDITDPNALELSKMEEAYMSRLVSKFPRALGGGFIRGSARSYTTFLNRLRADTFDAMAATLAKSSELTAEEGKAIANYVNVATGRGKIGLTPQAAAGLNTVFFAPRLVASRFNLLGGQPLYGGTARTRALVASEYARFVAGIGVVFALAAMAHDDDDPDRKVELDPRSANFLKIKFGNTYLDPMTGLAQVTTFLARELTGEKLTGKGELVPLRNRYRLSDATGEAVPPNYKVRFGGDTGADILARFARTKLAPVPGAIVNLVAGENLVGEETTIPGEASSLVTPLSFRDIDKIYKEHGIGNGSAIVALNLLGFGVQYRDPRKKDEKAGK